MRSSRWLLGVLGALALVPASAMAAGVDAAYKPAASTVVPKALPRLGVMADAGLPDGANGSLVYRPFSWLRAHAGGGTNLIGKGFRGGLTLLPFGSGPSASLEAGHYFDGDANGMARRFAGPTFGSPALERVGYDYANFHLGLDFGSRRATFFIHGGMSYVRAEVHNLDAAVASSGGMSELGNGSTEISFTKDPIVRAWLPSVKLGLIVYIW
jgi:hypothetical protein